jgi:DNA polymerase-3 subunit delta'
MHSYPWYSNIRHLFLTNKKKLSHAQILYGGDKVGRNTLILDLCQTLLCQNIASDLNACNECQACHWFERASHPDFYLIDDTGETNNISIEVIRELKDFFELSSHYQDSYKIAAVMNAENLSKASANALLKILEEPPNNCYIFLAIANLSNALPTIRSRCQLVSLPNPSKEQMDLYIKNNEIKIDYGQLEFLNNSVHALSDENDRYAMALEIIEELKKGNSVQLSKTTTKWLDYGLKWFVDVIQKWTYEIFLNKLTNQHCYFPQHHQMVGELAKKSSLENLLLFQKRINEIKLYSIKPVNKDLNLDLILLEYKKIFS